MLSPDFSLSHTLPFVAAITPSRICSRLPPAASPGISLTAGKFRRKLVSLLTPKVRLVQASVTAL